MDSNGSGISYDNRTLVSDAGSAMTNQAQR